MDVKTPIKFFLAGTLLVTALSACSRDDGAMPAAPGTSAGTATAGVTPSESDDVMVLQPGEPGEDAATGSATPPPPAPWNHADVAFVQMMVPHHAQAMQMARLARTRAQDPAVRRLATRIAAAQGPEILLMASWLEEQGVDVPSAAEDPMSYDHSQHGHEGMAGMLTPARMRDLARARGTEFDRMFLRSMIRHHQGALDMADTVAVEGSAHQVSELAAEVSSGQGAEIGRMRQLLATQG